MAMTDDAQTTETLNSKTAFAITKSDATVFTKPTRWIFVGTAGDLTVLLANDTVPVTFKNIANGTLLPLRATKVMAATTAQHLIGLN